MSLDDDFEVECGCIFAEHRQAFGNLLDCRVSPKFISDDVTEDPDKIGFQFRCHVEVGPASHALASSLCRIGRIKCNR